MSVAAELLDVEGLARELAREPELLPAVVKRFTGRRSASDQERNLVAAAMRLNDASDREIAIAIGCSTRSIPFILREAEKSGRVAAVKNRLAQRAESLAERSGIALHKLLDRVEDGAETVELAAMLKATGTVYGIATDKSQLLTGSPTEILELRVGAGRAEIEEFCRANSLAIEVESTAIDSASVRVEPQLQQIGEIEDGGHVGDTDVAPEHGPDLDAEGGGGGVRVAPGGMETTMDSTGSKFSP